MVERRLGEEDGFGVDVFGGFGFAASSSFGVKGEGAGGHGTSGGLEGTREFALESEEEDGHDDLFHLICNDGHFVLRVERG